MEIHGKLMKSGFLSLDLFTMTGFEYVLADIESLQGV